MSKFSDNGISANCLSVGTKNRAFSAKLKISDFETAQEVPLPTCRRLLFPLLHKGNRRRLHSGKKFPCSEGNRRRLHASSLKKRRFERHTSTESQAFTL